jgi:hypothetical protein
VTKRQINNRNNRKCLIFRRVALGLDNGLHSSGHRLHKSSEGIHRDSVPLFLQLSEQLGLVVEPSSTDPALQNLPEMLDEIEVRALARSLHHRDVDSGVSEPTGHVFGCMLRVVILLELVELGTISLPVGQQVLAQNLYYH